MKLQTYHDVAAVPCFLRRGKKDKSEALQTFFPPHSRRGKIKSELVGSLSQAWELARAQVKKPNGIQPAAVRACTLEKGVGGGGRGGREGGEEGGMMGKCYKYCNRRRPLDIGFLDVSGRLLWGVVNLSYTEGKKETLE